MKSPVLPAHRPWLTVTRAAFFFDVKPGYCSELKFVCVLICKQTTPVQELQGGSCGPLARNGPLSGGGGAITYGGMCQDFMVTPCSFLFSFLLLAVQPVAVAGERCFFAPVHPMPRLLLSRLQQAQMILVVVQRPQAVHLVPQLAAALVDIGVQDRVAIHQ